MRFCESEAGDDEEPSSLGIVVTVWWKESVVAVPILPLSALTNGVQSSRRNSDLSALGTKCLDITDESTVKPVRE